MRKLLYRIALLVGVGLFIWLYVFNFDNFSETELVQIVLYWYTPLVFGLYGLTALRMRKHFNEQSSSVIGHLFSGNDPLMLPLMIVLFILGSVIGLILFFLPISIFSIKKDDFDIKVSITATAIFLGLLWFFFVALWPSL